MEIFARLISGKTITVDVFPANDTIADVKRMIEDKEEFPRAQQPIIFAGEALDDNRALHHYNIGDESYTLTLVLDQTKKRKREA